MPLFSEDRVNFPNNDVTTVCVISVAAAAITNTKSRIKTVATQLLLLPRTSLIMTCVTLFILTISMSAVSVLGLPLNTNKHNQTSNSTNSSSIACYVCADEDSDCKGALQSTKTCDANSSSCMTEIVYSHFPNRKSISNYRRSCADRNNCPIDHVDVMCTELYRNRMICRSCCFTNGCNSREKEQLLIQTVVERVKSLTVQSGVVETTAPLTKPLQSTTLQLTTQPHTTPQSTPPSRIHQTTINKRLNDNNKANDTDNGYRENDVKSRDNSDDENNGKNADNDNRKYSNNNYAMNNVSTNDFAEGNNNNNNNTSKEKNHSWPREVLASAAAKPSANSSTNIFIKTVFMQSAVAFLSAIFMLWLQKQN